VKYRKLGPTDIEVSVVAMGCWAMSGGRTWGPQDEADSIATVHAALDAGSNFFDTAEAYGSGVSEGVLGRALKGRRHEAVIATKVSRSNLSHDDVVQACERSLRRLQTDTIDLYQIHWPSRTVPIEETFAALDKLRQQGKVRAIGVSNFGVGDLAELLAVGWRGTDQLPYSLLWRALEYDVHPKAGLAAGTSPRRAPGAVTENPAASPRCSLLSSAFAVSARVLASQWRPSPWRGCWRGQG
jgi:myo-inositol catabolism protein IolS